MITFSCNGMLFKILSPYSRNSSIEIREACRLKKGKKAYNSRYQLISEVVSYCLGGVIVCYRRIIERNNSGNKSRKSNVLQLKSSLSELLQSLLVLHSWGWMLLLIQLRKQIPRLVIKQSKNHKIVLLLIRLVTVKCHRLLQIHKVLNQMINKLFPLHLLKSMKMLFQMQVVKLLRLQPQRMVTHR